MKQTTQKHRRLFAVLSVSLLAAFALWTVLLTRADVRPVGPNGSSVGLATLNAAFHRITGVHMTLYVITDWLGLVPVATCMGFGVLGLVQWIRRKKLRRVDRSLLVLGGLYLAVMGAYLLFEELAVNYRPVLLGGYLEASYPSSTTLLVLCVMPTAATQLWGRIKGVILRRAAVWAIGVFTVFMVLARLVSGVHWLTDILGGVLLSGGLVAGYEALR